MADNNSNTPGSGLSAYLLPVGFLMVLRGSEDRRPVWNLLGCLLLLFLTRPSLVMALRRPNHLFQRLFSGGPMVDATNSVISSLDRETSSNMEEEPNNESVISSLETNDESMDKIKDGLGAGAINEKRRKYARKEEAAANASSGGSQYDPSNQTAHLLHSIEGLQRYPNYLERWQPNDIERLETSLQEKLNSVRQQKQLLEKRRSAVENLVQDMVSKSKNKERWEKLLTPCQTWKDVRERILDPKAAEAIFKSKMFLSKYNQTIPSVEAVVKGEAKVDLDPEHLEAMIDEEFYDVFSFQLLSREFCQDLREFIQELSNASQSNEELQEYGKRPAFNIDIMGLAWVNDLLFHLVMKPLARQLYMQSENLVKDLDFRNGYIAGYSAKPGIGKPRERLVAHTDDAEVTMNCCLGDVFDGGLVEFRGLRGTKEEGQLVGTFQPQLGMAVIHSGRHFHHVTQVLSGDRFAYIMWARSWGGTRSEKCPCCWLNRRMNTDCICGARWN